jgi:hypothetical protein
VTSRVLYAYPVEATADNWLHDCLVEILNAIHTGIQDGNAPPPWPDMIPAVHRLRLRRRKGLRERLRAYADAFAALQPAEREVLIRAPREQNQIARLLCNEADCQTTDQLPVTMRGPISQLFGFGFELLMDFDVRDRFYRRIYDSIKHKVCPFCGCEFYDAPGAPREALDHYLPRSRYTFAAVNLRNLVPMGNKCNSRYKLAQDILRNADGTRRRALDPYGAVTIRISLARSVPFGATDGVKPGWEIDFVQDSEEAATWDAVFSIRERYKRDVLDQEFRIWLDQFASWCRSANVVAGPDHELIDAVRRYSISIRDPELQDKNFLRAEVFDLFLSHCEHGEERVLSLIRALARLKPRH